MLFLLHFAFLLLQQTSTSPRHGVPPKIVIKLSTFSVTADDECWLTIWWWWSSQLAVTKKRNKCICLRLRVNRAATDLVKIIRLMVSESDPDCLLRQQRNGAMRRLPVGCLCHKICPRQHRWVRCARESRTNNRRHVILTLIVRINFACEQLRRQRQRRRFLIILVLLKCWKEEWILISVSFGTLLGGS